MNFKSKQPWFKLSLNLDFLKYIQFVYNIPNQTVLHFKRMCWDYTRDDLFLVNKVLRQTSTTNLHIFDNSLVIISQFAVPMKN
jgi:hypothetical protein